MFDQLQKLLDRAAKVLDADIPTKVKPSNKGDELFVGHNEEVSVSAWEGKYAVFVATQKEYATLRAYRWFNADRRGVGSLVDLSEAAYQVLVSLDFDIRKVREVVNSLSETADSTSDH